MEPKAYLLKEFIEITGAEQDDLELWEKLKLIKPIGFTEDKVAFYSHETLKQVKDIQKLLDLGYQPEDIQKIIKKIGLPNKDKKPNNKLKKDQFLTVGQLAEKVDVSPRTLKHWEDKGILIADMRSEGGFRMYAEYYVYICKLILDLQLFGYSLDEIKTISDHFRDFIVIQEEITTFPKSDTAERLDVMDDAIARLLDKTGLLKQGIQRWEDLLKKKKKELSALKNQNLKREEPNEGTDNA